MLSAVSAVSRFILHQHVAIFRSIRISWARPKSRLMEHTLIHTVVKYISLDTSFMIFLFFNRKLLEHMSSAIFLWSNGRFIDRILKNLVNSSILRSLVIDVRIVNLYV